MIICTCGPCKTSGRKGMYFMKHFLLPRTVTLTRPLNDYMDWTTLETESASARTADSTEGLMNILSIT